VAAAAALGVAELVAIFTGPQSAPLVAVGGVVIDSVPGSVKDLAVKIFFTYDKVALISGTLVLLALFAAGFGILGVRRIGWGLAGVGVFGLVGLSAAVTRHAAGPGAVFPTLIGTGVGALVLVRLVRLINEPPGEAASGDARRQFLRLAGGTLVGAVIVGVASRYFATGRNVKADRAAVKLPAPASPAPTLPADTAAGIQDLSPFVTPNGDFYRIDTALVVPEVAAATWSLKIHGRVKTPLTLTYQQLLARPMIERFVTLACVSNDVGGSLISNARWLGVPIKDLLDEVEPLDGADQVVSRSVDGFTAGTPTEALRDGRDAILAVGMNGVPLPIEHGYPVRMVVPGLYGYVSATKWLAEWELTSFADFDAYWISRGWSQQAPIKTESRIDTPRDGASRNRGQVMIAGVAWSQHRGISKVEVQIDDGDWQVTKLADVPSIDTWRQWSYPWAAAPGKHRLTVRATDNAGDVQTTQVAPPDPDGATGLHTIQVDIR
jgi:DMSO/TMAO reductase YedYZ molybdopterin-dependent catalytic subunit